MPADTLLSSQSVMSMSANGDKNERHKNKAKGFGMAVVRQADSQLSHSSVIDHT